MALPSTAVTRLAAMLVTLVACTDSHQPLAPSSSPPITSAPIAPTIPSGFPSISRPGVGFYRVTSSFIPGYSRYVLYEDGTFSLQYLRPDVGFFEYPGKFSGAASALTFEFDGWSTAGPWLANGVVDGNSLTVKYNTIMMLSDFEDGVYSR